jgi:hypothetical protein
MAARRTREEARARLRKLLEAEPDRTVLLDPAVPMKGRTFRDSEMLAWKLKEAVMAQAVLGKDTPQAYARGKKLEDL